MGCSRLFLCGSAILGGCEPLPEGGTPLGCSAFFFVGCAEGGVRPAGCAVLARSASARAFLLLLASAPLILLPLRGFFHPSDEGSVPVCCGERCRSSAVWGCCWGGERGRSAAGILAVCFSIWVFSEVHPPDSTPATEPHWGCCTASPCNHQGYQVDIAPRDRQRCERVVHP